ncbi:hypothetical protein M9458_023992, partial [Cirrhinus mrigala]
WNLHPNSLTCPPLLPLPPPLPPILQALTSPPYQRLHSWPQVRSLMERATSRPKTRNRTAAVPVAEDPCTKDK